MSSTPISNTQRSRHTRTTTSYAALGAGSNTIYVDPANDIVIDWRWHNGNPNELVKRVLAAVKNAP